MATSTKRPEWFDFWARHELMRRYHWTWAQVADIPACLLQAVLDA